MCSDIAEDASIRRSRPREDSGLSEPWRGQCHGARDSRDPMPEARFPNDYRDARDRQHGQQDGKQDGRFDENSRRSPYSSDDRIRHRASDTRISSGIARLRFTLQVLKEHFAADGALVAIRFCFYLCLHQLQPLRMRFSVLVGRSRMARLSGIASLWERFAPRDPGERAAERFLRALHYRTLARNWRSPRDPRDEADLIMLTPDQSTVVLVEVKRARGPWDGLDRVDVRKREVLWRLLQDISDGKRPRARTSIQSVAVDRAQRTARTRASPPIRIPDCARAVRVDLVGVRGEGRTASAVRHVVGLFERTRKPSSVLPDR